MERRPIISVLRNMNVGEKEIFPIEQRRSIRVTISDYLVEERINGVKWSVETDMANKAAIVTRKQ